MTHDPREMEESRGIFHKVIMGNPIAEGRIKGYNDSPVMATRDNSVAVNVIVVRIVERYSISVKDVAVYNVVTEIGKTHSATII